MWREDLRRREKGGRGTGRWQCIFKGASVFVVITGLRGITHFTICNSGNYSKREKHFSLRSFKVSFWSSLNSDIHKTSPWGQPPELQKKIFSPEIGMTSPEGCPGSGVPPQRRSASPRQAAGGPPPPVTTQLEGRGWFQRVTSGWHTWALKWNRSCWPSVIWDPSINCAGFSSHSACPLWKSLYQAPVYQ